MSAVPSDRSQARRQQVLDAAADCFRRRGFHGAGMAEIAKTAGMSPGHIYNLFENKDDIIAAIVEHDRDTIVQKINDVQREDDALRAMLDWIESGGIEESTQASDAALGLEIMAEASRNPRLAAVVQASEAKVCQKACALVQQTLGPGAEALSADEIKARAIVVSALFNGLMVLSVAQPQMDKAAVAKVMRRVLNLLHTP